MLSITPAIDPKKQHISLKNWKKFEPLTVKEILEHRSEVPVDFGKRIVLDSHWFPDALVQGQFIPTTNQNKGSPSIKGP